MKEKAILLGHGAHAKVVLEIIEEMNQYEIIGCCSSDPNPPDQFCNIPFIGDFNKLTDYYNNGIHKVINGIGGWTDNNFRIEVFDQVKKIGFNVVKAIHPTAVIANNVQIGEGSMIGSAAVIMTEAKIGENAIISTSSLISHETTICNHVLISGAAKIGAQVVIEENSVIAFGATVLSRVSVGNRALVAAGAVVINNVLDDEKVFGLPARVK
jgi:UDP-perosamine 4-acetyltransferase